MHLLTLCLLMGSTIGAPVEPATPLSGLNIPEGYGHYATVFTPGSNVTFALLATNFRGVPRQIFSEDFANLQELQPFSPTRFKDGLALSPPSKGVSVPGLATRDICQHLRGCFTIVADSATSAALYIANTSVSGCTTIYNLVLSYFRDNNYANLNAVLQGAAVGIAVNIISVPIGAAIQNSWHFKSDLGDSDSCGVHERDNLSNDFASALYDFCIAIQQAQSTEYRPSHYFAGATDDNQNYPTGDVSLTKAFIAAQAGNFGPVCASLGIAWKRWIDEAVSYLPAFK